MPSKDILDPISVLCRPLHGYIARNGPEDVVTFTQRKLNEAVAEKVRSRPELLRDWLQGALEGVRAGVEAE